MDLDWDAASESDDSITDSLPHGTNSEPMSLQYGKTKLLLPILAKSTAVAIATVVGKSVAMPGVHYFNITFYSQFLSTQTWTLESTAVLIVNGVL